MEAKLAQPPGQASSSWQDRPRGGGGGAGRGQRGGRGRGGRGGYGGGGGEWVGKRRAGPGL